MVIFAASWHSDLVKPALLLDIEVYQLYADDVFRDLIFFGKSNVDELLELRLLFFLHRRFYLFKIFLLDTHISDFIELYIEVTVRQVEVN